MDQTKVFIHTLPHTAPDSLFKQNEVTHPWDMPRHEVCEDLEQQECWKLEGTKGECSAAKVSMKAILDHTCTTLDHCISIWHHICELEDMWMKVSEGIDELIQQTRSLAHCCNLENDNAVECQVQCWLVQVIPEP